MNNKDRALTLIGELKDRGAINNKEVGTLRRAILLNEQTPTEECKPYQCDYYDFAKRIIDGIVDVMRYHGMESLEDINSELDRMNKVLGGNNDE